MSTTAETIRNGVDTEQLYGTLDAMKADPTPEEKLREIVARAQQRSAVFDMVTNGVPVAIHVATA